LSKDGTPESEIEKVEQQIADVEAKLDKIFEENKEFEDVDAWRAALKASREGVQKERDFVENAEFLQPIRALSINEAVQLELLKHRLAYLKVLSAEVVIQDEASKL
jgi:hypothetical protein